MSERHPYGSFIPAKVKYLIMGSFPGKPIEGNDWFYGSKRNQFWPLLEMVYKVKLISVKQKKYLLRNLQMAMTDIILECERENNSNLDTNLKCLVFNTKAIGKILRENPIEKIFFTSRYVEKLFKRHFKAIILKCPEIELITLPSPSPSMH